MMKPGVLPLNVVAACFYLILSALALFLLKRANRPRRNVEPRDSKHQSAVSLEGVSTNKLLVVSWLKKYTVGGGIFCEDKKFMVKEIVIISVYGITCLNINKTIQWPAALSLVPLVVCFVFWEIILKKWEQRSGKEVSQAKPNAVNNQPQSQLEIDHNACQNQAQIINVPTIKVFPSAKEPPKGRTLLETVSTSLLCFAALVMMLQSAMTLSTSISNSGELNIISVLTIIVIDQIAIRLPLGGLFILGCKGYIQLAGIKDQQNTLFCLFCSEEITQILIDQEKERKKRELAMTASPPREKRPSPSKVPKALGLSVERPTYLNLINLQPTVREAEDDEVVEEIYLTTAEKDLFQCNALEQKNGFYTRRARNRENKEYYCYSAQKGTTIDIKEKKECDDMLILKQEPFGVENQIGEFCLEESGVRQTKRKGTHRRRNKRNLQLCGSSPYLQYLPDMLKKVDKYKEMAANKQNKDNTKAIR